MAFACLVAPSLLNLDDIVLTSNSKSKSTPQLVNDIIELFDDPKTSLSSSSLGQHDYSKWNIIVIIAGFATRSECSLFVTEWKQGRKLIPRLIRGLQLAISRNQTQEQQKLAVCFPCYPTHSVQRVVSSFSNTHRGVQSESANRSSS